MEWSIDPTALCPIVFIAGLSVQRQDEYHSITPALASLSLAYDRERGDETPERMGKLRRRRETGRRRHGRHGGENAEHTA